MPSGTRSALPAALFLALAASPATAAAQALARPATRAVPVVAPKYTLEVEGGAGYTSVNAQKWSGSMTALADWNTTAYLGSGRLFFARAGNFRVGIEAGYSYFFWYTSTGAGYGITREPHATRVGGVVRSALGARLAADAGAAAYIFPDGTVLGVNAALGYFVPAGARLSIPVRVRVDLPFTSAATVLSIAGTLGLSYRF